MTTAEFLNRLLRATNLNSFDKLEADDAQTLIDALNSAMSTYYGLIPEQHRKNTFSHAVSAPRGVSLELTNGSKTIGGTSPLSDSDKWKTVRITGDDKWNRIQSTTELLDAYGGESGTVAATLYSDVILLSGVLVERMTSDPRLDTGEVLFHDESLREFRYAYGSPYAVREVYGMDSNRQIGRPRRYWMDMIANRNTEAIEPTGVVVLDPLPDAAYTARFEALVFPLRYGLDIITSPQTLPVPQSHIEVGLIPLALEFLAESGMPTKMPMEMVFNRAIKARNYIETRPAYIGVPHNIEGTPPGW